MRMPTYHTPCLTHAPNPHHRLRKSRYYGNVQVVSARAALFQVLSFTSDTEDRLIYLGGRVRDLLHVVNYGHRWWARGPGGMLCRDVPAPGVLPRLANRSHAHPPAPELHPPNPHHASPMCPSTPATPPTNTPRHRCRCRNKAQTQNTPPCAGTLT